MTVLYNKLIEENNDYRIDYDDLREKAKEADFIIFCNPHNPIGKEWNKEEIEKMANICIEEGVTIISDEMYSDIMLWGTAHIPTASISEKIAKNTITCTSLGKTFNLAGLHVATCIFPNEEMKAKYDKILAKFETKRNNAFSVVATQVAMNECKDWFDEVIKYIEDNFTYVMDYIDANIPRLKYSKPDGTYLLWLDCRDLNMTQEELVSFFVNDAKLALNNGITFGEEGKGFMRMNIASPRSVLKKAMKQLEDAVNNLK
jgi:cystathionine beta-lyase